MRFQWPRTTDAQYHADNERQVERLKNWHRAFAWWPVRVNQDHIAWLETVARRYPNAESMSGLFKGVRLEAPWLYYGPAEYRAVVAGVIQ